MNHCRFGSTSIVTGFFAMLTMMFIASANAQDRNRGTTTLPRFHRIDARTVAGMQELFHATQQPLPFVSAHRGGPQKDFPENCIATFENTLVHTFAILEIDPRYAGDGTIVVHHDSTLDRTTTGNGAIAKFSLPALKQLRLKDTQGNVTEYQIPTLDEVLEWAKGKTIVVLDQKDVPTTERVQKITQYNAEAYAMLIVNSFKDATTCYALNPNIMMEVMIPSLDKAKQFDKLGIPWRNVVAFVGHTPPDEKELYEFIHAKGACCMVGSSRNIDRNWIEGKVSDMKLLESDYQKIIERGADIIETDIPTQLGPMLYKFLDLNKQFMTAP